MESLTRWVLAHKRTVVVGWTLLATGGIAASGSIGGALSKDFSVSGDAARANLHIAAIYGNGGHAFRSCQ